MPQTAKIFMNGRSQAVRLPAEFRFDETEVYIRRDEITGDVVISRKRETWGDFFELADNSELPSDFMSVRDNEAPQDRDLF